MGTDPISQDPDGASAHNIFCYPSGVPLEIFVDAGVVPGRPKLIRTLRTNGASICKSVALAQIILVDPATTSGRQFIRDWGQAKLVLEYLWARKSVDKHRALLEDDNWGGYRTIDDGRPIKLEVDADYEDKKDTKDSNPKSVVYHSVPLTALSRSPLPTPRPSPPEPSLSSQLCDPRVFRPSSSAPTPSTESHFEPVLPAPVENSQLDGASRGLPAPNDVRTYPTPSQPSTQFQLQPSTVQSSQPQPLNSNSAQHFLQPQQIGGHPTQQFAQSQPANSDSTQHFVQPQFINGNPMQHFTQSQPQSGSSHPMPYRYQSLPVANNPTHNFPQPHQGTFIPPFHSNYMHAFSQPQYNPNIMMNPQGLHALQPPDGQNILQSMVDIMRHQGISPMHAQAVFMQNMTHPSWYSQPQMDNFTQPPSQSSDANSDAILNTSVPSPIVKPDLQIRSSLHQSRDRSSPSPLPSPLSSPSSPLHSVKFPPLPRPKGKRKAVSPVHSRDRESASAVWPALTQSSAISPSVASTSSKEYRKVCSPRSPGKIFTSKSGESLSFFVQVDLRHRLPVITKIKTNGGVIDSSHINADYAILYRNSSSFPSLLKSRVAAEKPALGSAFVDDCVAKEALLDPTTYEFQKPVSPKRKRGRASTSPSGTKKVQRRQKQTAKEKQDKEQEKGGKEQEAKGKKRARVKEENTPPYCGPPSPTPPPDTKVLHREGNYLFSKPEQDYMSRYARFLLKKDPSISNIAIGRALNTKLPHHSARSWANFVTHQLFDDLNTLRKVDNAHGKAESTVHVQQSPSGYRKVGPNGTIVDSPRSAKELTIEKQDLEAICQFFAAGGDDGGDEEHVWSLLATYQECKSAATWPDFYESHTAEVDAGIARLYSVNAVDTTSAGPSAGALPKMEDEGVWG